MTKSQTATRRRIYASYRRAIEFIAREDSAGDGNALIPDEVQWLITAQLVAGIFGKDCAAVGADIVRYRRTHGIHSKTALELAAHVEAAP